jgi:hypothetical protein
VFSRTVILIAIYCWAGGQILSGATNISTETIKLSVISLCAFVMGNREVNDDILAQGEL